MSTATETIFEYMPEHHAHRIRSAMMRSVPVENGNELFSTLKRDKLQRATFFIGAGTCGLGAGAQKTIDRLKKVLADRSLDYDLVEVGCIGLCSSEPLLDVQLPGKNRISFTRMTADKVDGLISDLLDGDACDYPTLGQFQTPNTPPWPNVPFISEHPFFKPQTRFVLKNCGIINPGSIEEYIANGGYRALGKCLQNQTPDEVISSVIKSGLRGRGGGGFPAAQKWKLARESIADQKYLICNADEGDPGAFMDRAVIEGDPHRLIEGMALAAYSIGASKAYIYIRAEYPLAISRLRKAIEDALKYGFLGENILDSGFSLKLIIKMGAGAFVCGEETALMASIEGKRGMPRPRPPFPTSAGLFGKPTVINNVETLANVPTILDNGPEWFASVGTEKSKGTKVFALSGKVNNTGLIEVAMGTTLRQIVFDIGNGIPGKVPYKAVQIGGPSGGCIPEQHLDIEIDYESLKTVGAMMGSGGLVVMDQNTCMVDMAKYFMEFIQRESCGKCIPCREGTKRMLEILQAITRSRRNESKFDALDRFNGIINLTQLAQVIQDTSLCGLGQTAPNPVLSTLRWFRHEYEAHIFERRCPAKACTELVSYSIDAEKCIGCTACSRKCPSQAIMGTAKAPHYIIPDKCIGCGACVTACRFNAVLTA